MLFVIFLYFYKNDQNSRQKRLHTSVESKQLKQNNSLTTTTTSDKSQVVHITVHINLHYITLLLRNSDTFKLTTAA